MRISDWSSDVCSSDLAYGLRIPAWMHAWPTPEFGAGAQRADAARQPVAAHTPIESRSRAAAIADAVAITQRREAVAAQGGSGSRAVHIARSLADRERGERFSPASTAPPPGPRTPHRLSRPPLEVGTTP